MSTVYTAHLWSVISSLFGDQNSDPVPAGHRWVITDVYLQSPFPQYIALSNGAYVRDDQGVTICGIHRAEGAGGRSYHWTGRQVLDVGDHIHFLTYTAGWSVRITGFNLLLP